MKKAARTAGSCVAVALTLSVGLAGCAAPEDVAQRGDGVMDVAATTSIIADLARNVVGPDARVTSLIPPGADPHSYEPRLRDVRAVANADVILANHLLLEDQAMMSTVRNSAPAGVEVTELAEASERYGASLQPMIEDLSLDTPWLGARAEKPRQVPRPAGGEPGAAAASQNSGQVVDLVLTDFSGPGDMAAYITGAFGTPQVNMSTENGVDDRDVIRLPAGAHTHMSWAFTKPGHYQAVFEARDGDAVLARGEVDFAVGVDPGPAAITTGHWDISFEPDSGRLGVRGDDGLLHHGAVEVPGRALQQVPAQPAYRFLSRPGTEVYVLPQAVLGKHVHGEIDPHVWHDPANMRAMVQVIRDAVSARDPRNAQRYAANADAYLAQIDEVDAFVREQIDSLPADRKNLVTTHDGYSYLGRRYGLNIAGFVSPNPAVQPSARDMVALTRTLEGLKVPAVFLEPAQAARPGPLSEVAGDLGVQICTIHGDALGPDVPTYLDLMKTNAKEISECLR